MLSISSLTRVNIMSLMSINFLKTNGGLISTAMKIKSTLMASKKRHSTLRLNSKSLKLMILV